MALRAKSVTRGTFLGGPRKQGSAGLEDNGVSAPKVGACTTYCTGSLPFLPPFFCYFCHRMMGVALEMRREVGVHCWPIIKQRLPALSQLMRPCKQQQMKGENDTVEGMAGCSKKLIIQP